MHAVYWVNVNLYIPLKKTSFSTVLVMKCLSYLLIEKVRDEIQGVGIFICGEWNIDHSFILHSGIKMACQVWNQYVTNAQSDVHIDMS